MGVRIQDDRILRFLSDRSKMMFHSRNPLLYLKLFQGTAISATQWSLWRTTFEYHLLSQKLLKASVPEPPPDTMPSRWTPAGVREKKNPLRPSLKGPMLTPKLSLRGYSKRSEERRVGKE